ncbi:conserved hypothetical protein [Flavobacterium sp. 9AF]|uniref:hypothetical protein n=1 Tax=Flavobacterium sp. 9AF TaxID=2653142 RepID=UPI0012F3C61B|nr:hypothetical protein [Flavobacterium sp. 9AF]VXC12940.1 conserved hypothetical protein [Flavobacterium sp. 9AF]
MQKIQVGFLVSYDYELLKNAIPPVYDASDTIFLAIDKSRKTWNGSDIHIDASFFEWVKEFDIKNKIQIYEDNFFVEGLSTMECEIRERKLLADQMGIGNWLIQLDADEYFFDFKKFTTQLQSYNHFLTSKKHVQICCFKINLYKNVNSGVLYVDLFDKFMVATNIPNYKIGRHGKCRSIYVDAIALHDCLSREREDLIKKLDNWGHNEEIDKESFMQKWDAVNETNYQDFEGFFYLDPMDWKTLKFMNGNSLDEVLNNFKNDSSMKISNWFLMKKNIGQWFKFLFK